MQPGQGPTRGLVISLALGLALACLVLSGAYISIWQGQRDGMNHAVGRDFVNLWTASRLVEAERAVEVFDQDKFAATQRQQFGADFPFHFWSYPPHALFLTEGLAGLPYRAALAVWSLSGLLLMFLAARSFWPGSGQIGGQI